MNETINIGNFNNFTKPLIENDIGLIPFLTYNNMYICNNLT